MGPLTETSTQLAILDGDPERIPMLSTSPQSSSLGKRVGHAALKALALVSGLSLVTISYPMIKAYDGPEDPQSRITGLGIVLMMVGNACMVASLVSLFKRCCCPGSNSLSKS